jgi:hypothetical protein
MHVKDQITDKEGKEGIATGNIRPEASEECQGPVRQQV